MEVLEGGLVQLCPFEQKGGVVHPHFFEKSGHSFQKDFAARQAAQRFGVLL